MLAIFEDGIDGSAQTPPAVDFSPATIIPDDQAIGRGQENSSIGIDVEGASYGASEQRRIRPAELGFPGGQYKQTLVLRPYPEIAVSVFSNHQNGPIRKIVFASE